MAKNSRDAYGADGEQKVLLIDPTKLKLVTDEVHPLYDERVHLPVDPALVESIMADGILQAIGIVKDTETGEILVAWGRQRVKAALVANPRLKKAGKEIVLAPCVVRRNDAATLFGQSISENEMRQADTPIGRARKMARLIELGRGEAQVAQKFGCTISTVKNLLGLLDASAAVRKAVDAGDVTASEGYKLAKLEPDEQRKTLEKLKTAAPREKAGKRGKNATAKKRKAIVSGETGMRSRKDVEGMRGMIADSSKVPGADQRAAEAVLAWVLGEDTIGELFREGAT